MKLIIITAFFVAACLIFGADSKAFEAGRDSVTDHLSPKYQDALQQNPRLEFLGSVQGKFYFYDDTAQMTWFEARNYCQSMNMALASVISQQQTDFLLSNVVKLNKFPNTECCSSYWTSGRDAQTWSQFLWDGEEEEELTDFGPYDFFKTNVYTCVKLVMGGGLGATRIAANVCDARFKVLCQGF